MNIKNKLNKSDINAAEQIKEKINNADVLVIGAGAGLSASAGLDYGDKEFFKEYYAPFLKKGYQTIGEGISANWYLDEKSAQTYWGYWANHINNVYYKQPQLGAYKILYDVIKDKPYFIITTNGDGQFFKGNYDAKKIFAMQGSYGKFQCQKKCNDELYDNEEMIKKMLAGFDDNSLLIRKEDIPRCPNCGGLLAPNLRIDGNFVEGANSENQDDYVNFINGAIDKSVVFLELGVGYNTPVIIRFPFEQMTDAIKDGCLIRVNKFYPDLPKELGDKGISSTMDIQDLLETIA